uniref:Asteroid domain-containing protein n=1 Tax=Labrus bergylta TaxID=56723 RepID=A0A3Q3H213_9LABR
MGVPDLTSLIEANPEIYQKFEHDVCLLKCGVLCILCFSLVAGLDQNRGGEYAAFEDLVERFVKALKDCGISPYVVLDGSLDRLQNANKAAVESSQENVLPQMARTVLSNDSDFFIFDLPGGLLPISHFHWEVVKRIGSQSYIPSKIYYSSSFCKVFDIEPQLLPAFSSLAVNLQRLDALSRWAEFDPAVNGKSPHRLKGLLCWLKDFKQLEEAFEAALGLLGELSEETKAEVMEGLNLGMEEYQLPPSSLNRFFIDGVAPPFPLWEVKPEMAGWVLLLLTQARLNSNVLHVLLFSSINLSCPVERADFPSAHLTSRPIRQVIYRLLLGETLVKENDREGLEPKSFIVQPAASGVPQELELKSLNKVKLSNAEPSVRLQVLLDALGVPEACLEGLQPHLRLLVAVSCFWLQRAEPKPDETLLKALLLGVSQLTIVSTEDSSAAYALKREKKPFELRLDADALHSFNQWQGCLRQTVHLNQLLGFPLPEPQIAR